MPTNSILRSVLLLCLTAFCTSCVFNRLPSRNGRKKILAGQQTIVLVRVTAELLDGTPVSAFPSNLMADNVNIGLGTFDTGGELELVDSPRSLSVELREKGWIYLILEPGRYYFGIMGPQMTTYDIWKKQIKYAQRWRIDIPVDTHVVYIGTLHLYCRGMTTVFIGKIAKRCIEIDEHRTIIQNETVSAQKLADEYFGDYGSPQTLLIQRHDSPTIIFQAPGRE
jgi:hypothetical protein